MRRYPDQKIDDLNQSSQSTHPNQTDQMSQGYLVMMIRKGEPLIIGDDIEVIVTETTKNFARIAVKAPRHIRITRKKPKY